MSAKDVPCAYCGDALTVDELIIGNTFCSEECVLADLTGDESFVYVDED